MESAQISSVKTAYEAKLGPTRGANQRTRSFLLATLVHRGHLFARDATKMYNLAIPTSTPSIESTQWISETRAALGNKFRGRSERESPLPRFSLRLRLTSPAFSVNNTTTLSHRHFSSDLLLYVQCLRHSKLFLFSGPMPKLRRHFIELHAKAPFVIAKFHTSLRL